MQKESSGFYLGYSSSEVSWIQNPDYVPIHMKYASRGFLMFKHDASIKRVYTFPRWSPINKADSLGRFESNLISVL
ncbi:hypothetical protein [Escherichia phage FXie-2024a]